MRDVLLGWVRTLVPAVVGALIAWGVLPADLTDEAMVVGYALITSLYYLAVRIAESKAPWLGWLLGAPKAPTYSAKG